ncbi:hypothetical protein E2562_001965 [Oryza meyeriana var. granulata]|uniref:Uncharacterized protein n=1 Tax=Oryza meyeriana var. granulata TaxID=110450 RepID=A0A6G1C3C9_9ORYZ|nr:hypothetical protein E2562_001965 [Oryza meyeriana var. granulata]
MAVEVGDDQHGAQGECGATATSAVERWMVDERKGGLQEWQKGTVAYSGPDGKCSEEVVIGGLEGRQRGTQ